MTATPQLSRADFAQILAEHQQLIAEMNDLEYQLYRLAGLPPDERVSDCQQVGGNLVRLLRDMQFRHDQPVLPLLEASLPPGPQEKTMEHS